MIFFLVVPQCPYTTESYSVLKIAQSALCLIHNYERILASLFYAFIFNIIPSLL